MSAASFQDLIEHVGHTLEVVTYGDGQDGHVYNVAVECTDCNEVLLDFDNPHDYLPEDDQSPE